jgi:hypothetical protein
MRKPPLQDVIVKNQDRIRRNPVPERFASDSEGQHFRPNHVAPLRREPEVDFETEERYQPRMGSMRRDEQPSSRTNKKWLFTALGIGAIVVLSSVGLSLLFAGATVTVHPKQDTVVVNATFTALAEGAEGEGLRIERVVLERTATRAVVAQGEENVEERASGKIVIYNEYSETPQRLIKNTRFQSNDNRIYRIQESVEIPGKSTDGTAGNIEVMVYAEEPGESYNISEPHTFSIPGFEGLPQEELVYAKSVDAISGGFSGIRMSVSEQDRMTTLEELETQLRDELLSAAFESTDKPEGYHLFKEAVFFEFNALPDEVTEGDKVTLSLSGKLHGVLFKEDAFAKHIAQITLSSYTGTPIRIDNLADLSVTVTPDTGAPATSETDEDADTETVARSQNGTVLPWQTTRYKVLVQGKAHFIWEFDESTLAIDFAGKDKEQLSSPGTGGILELYPGIDRFEVSVRPFWKSTFPEEAKDIVIITKLDD